jgi:hypothetical protein
MRHTDQDALDRWLAAERDDRADEAEAALRALFEAVPGIAMAAPPAGFADRVLARAGLQESARADWLAWRPLRIVLALALAAAGFGVLWLPPVLRFVAGLWSVGGVVRGALRAVVEASQWLATALRCWDLLSTIAHALVQPVAVPQVMAALVVALLVSSLAFRVLRDQLTGERITYVDPI